MKRCMILLFILMLASGCQGNKGQSDRVSVQEKRLIKDVVLSQFSTVIKDSSENRVNNIKIACATLDGYKIEKGQEFSFNAAVGERNEEKGYMEATIFAHGEKTKAYGGGVCQVSTTLYNAALGAGLQITEKHSHSKDVAYVGEGQDAAVSYGSMDMKFVNNTNNDIYVEMYVENNNVVAKIYTKNLT